MLIYFSALVDYSNTFTRTSTQDVTVTYFISSLSNGQIEYIPFDGNMYQDNFRPCTSVTNPNDFKPYTYSNYQEKLDTDMEIQSNAHIIDVANNLSIENCIKAVFDYRLGGVVIDNINAIYPTLAAHTYNPQTGAVVETSWYKDYLCIGVQPETYRIQYSNDEVYNDSKNFLDEILTKIFENYTCNTVWGNNINGVFSCNCLTPSAFQKTPIYIKRLKNYYYQWNGSNDKDYLHYKLKTVTEYCPVFIKIQRLYLQNWNNIFNYTSLPIDLNVEFGKINVSDRLNVAKYNTDEIQTSLSSDNSSSSYSGVFKDVDNSLYVSNISNVYIQRQFYNDIILKNICYHNDTADENDSNIQNGSQSFEFNSFDSNIKPSYTILFNELNSYNSKTNNSTIEINNSNYISFGKISIQNCDSQITINDCKSQQIYIKESNGHILLNNVSTNEIQITQCKASIEIKNDYINQIITERINDYINSQLNKENHQFSNQLEIYFNNENIYQQIVYDIDFTYFYNLFEISNLKISNTQGYCFLLQNVKISTLSIDQNCQFVDFYFNNVVPYDIAKFYINGLFHRFFQITDFIEIVRLTNTKINVVLPKIFYNTKRSYEITTSDYTRQNYDYTNQKISFNIMSVHDINSIKIIQNDYKQNAYDFEIKNVSGQLLQIKNYQIENFTLENSTIHTEINGNSYVYKLNISNSKSKQFNSSLISKTLQTNIPFQKFYCYNRVLNIDDNEHSSNTYVVNTLEFDGYCDDVTIDNCFYDSVKFSHVNKMFQKDSCIKNGIFERVSAFNTRNVCYDYCNVNASSVTIYQSTFNSFIGTQNNEKKNVTNIQKSQFGTLRLYDFKQLLFMNNSSYQAQLSSINGNASNIKIECCQFGKLALTTYNKILDLKRYNQYLDQQLNDRINLVKENYIRQHGYPQNGFFSQEINLNDIQKLQQTLSEINPIFFNRVHQFILFSIQFCTFCSIELQTQVICANVCSNIATDTFKYKMIFRDEERQLDYDSLTNSVKYKKSIIMNDFNALFFGFGVNIFQKLYMNKNIILENLSLKGNDQDLKYIELSENKNLKYIELSENSVLETLIIDNCALEKLNITKKLFPRLKNIQITNNDKIFDWEKRVYKNEMVFGDIVVKQSQNTKEEFYNLTKRLQYSNIYDEQNGFVYKIIFNNVEVYVNENWILKLLSACQSNISLDTYKNGLYQKIKIFKASTIKQLTLESDVQFQKLIIRDTDCQCFNVPSTVKYLDVSCNRLSSLICQNLASVQYFNISNNNLNCFYNGTSINTIQNNKLKKFYANNNFIESKLVLNNNLIDQINIDDNQNLKYINLDNNSLVDFIAYKTSLNTVYISNQSKTIEVKQNNQTIKQTIYTLTNFVCDNIDDIRINGNVNLKKFISRNGKLKNFQIYSSILYPCLIQYIDVCNTELKKLYLDNCNNLIYLNVNNCNGIDFNFSKKTLKTLNCSNTGISKLLVSDSQIVHLQASFNNLQQIILPNTIKVADLSNNMLNTVKLLPIKDSQFNLRNNALSVVSIENANNISKFYVDNIQNLYLSGKQANTFIDGFNFDNVKKLCFLNENNLLQIRNKNIQSIQFYCTQKIDTSKQILFVENSEVCNCKITSFSNNDNQNGFQIVIKNSKLEKLIIDYSYVSQINIIDNYLSQIIISKPLNKIRKIYIVESDGYFDVQKFLIDVYSNLNHNNGGQINISSYKFNPYYKSSEEIIQKLNSKNWIISLN